MKNKKKIIYAIIVIFILLAFTLTTSVDWAYKTFGHLSIDELVFNIKVPIEGVNVELVWVFIGNYIIMAILPVILVSAILIYPTKKNLKIVKKEFHTSEKKETIIISLCISAVILIFSINKVVKQTNIKEYITNKIDNSTFINDEYIDPKQVNIQLGEKKRNLIYIYLESMESTYYSQKEGGLATKSLIPEIEKLAKNNISFSNTNKLGGAYSLSGTTWTVGAMVAQTTGLPLKIDIEDNAMDKYSSFLPGAYSIGEVLQENGYHNFLLVGSDATYGGRRNLFKQHGDYEIWDYISATKENRISEKVWWGYTDKLLFEFAKEKITELSKKEEPFNFTMLTVDTHFPDGYECEDCRNKFNEQYKNVIACSSKRVGEFIKWLQKQPFYKDTTIVLVGDHLTMQTHFFEDNPNYDKTVVNIIINSAVETNNTKNRQFSTMDLYPTTLATLGATIEGERLGLGTNLFSEEETLIEKYGIDYINKELKKTSKFYDNNILVSK